MTASLTTVSVYRHAINFGFLVDAVRNYPEFVGYEGKPFPGQPPPHKPVVFPKYQKMPKFNEDSCGQSFRTIRMFKNIHFEEMDLKSYQPKDETEVDPEVSVESSCQVITRASSVFCEDLHSDDQTMNHTFYPEEEEDDEEVVEDDDDDDDDEAVIVNVMHHKTDNDNCHDETHIAAKKEPESLLKRKTCDDMVPVEID